MAFFFFFIALLTTVATGAIGYYAFQLWTQLRDCRVRSQLLEQQNSVHDAEKQKWQVMRSKMLEELRGLSKFKGVEDAVGKAARMKAAAKERLRNANVLAEDTLNNAKKEAKAEISKARSETKTLRDDVAQTLNSATLEASKIVAEARKKAKETAGSVYEVMEKSVLFEQTAKAMRNLIKGYGDEYIIPEESLLDDLADDFGFDKAGQALKLARERTKQMMINGTAAACDYAETSRRENAINFVLDAFNGKVVKWTPIFGPPAGAC